MSGFWTDLNRELEKYERSERDHEFWDRVEPDWRDLSTDPECRVLIPEDDLSNKPTNLARTA